MKQLTVLLVGSGGREHALAWKIAQSPRLKKLYIAPGNPGTMRFGENVPIAATDIRDLVDFAQAKRVDFVVIGPDDPLSIGIVDAFHTAGILVFGPTKAAAELEWSKAYAKDFMLRHNIPTARYETFTQFERAVAYADEQSYPLVIKASGLALGKGVIIAKNKHEALETLREIMIEKVFGDAGSEVVIEEFLDGIEFSVHVFSDGKTWRLFPASQDHKRVHDDDQGLNTGGMGVVSPLPFIPMDMLARIDREIVTPALSGMADEGKPFVGILYPGVMLTAEGPKVFEFNVRFGDPETQTYMRMLETDILGILEACALGTLHEIDIHWRNDISACNVILASAGYPGSYEKGKQITGIMRAEEDPNVVVFQAGTKLENGELVTSGGRVLSVSAIASNPKDALDAAYEAIEKIHFWGKQYRKDIGKKALVAGLQ
jgi:phosphoribosylamine--glycine ligase